MQGCECFCFLALPFLALGFFGLTFGIFGLSLGESLFALEQVFADGFCSAEDALGIVALLHVGDDVLHLYAFADSVGQQGFHAVARLEDYAVVLGVEVEEDEQSVVALSIADAPRLKEGGGELTIGHVGRDGRQHDHGDICTHFGLQLLQRAVDLRLVAGGEDGVGVADVVASVREAQVGHLLHGVDGRLVVF